ncbi:MAG: ATP-binding protein [Candidatus Aminicenantes bacterium]|nr:ATP-binding protein [Candidatus Aminicenantes bacterium]
MKDFEKLGAFYLGRIYDLDEGRVREDLLLYDSKDLTTHAVCVGMTGSGKTGLCVGLLEEAAIDGIPSLVIDPKGDLGNLMLAFPDLKQSDFLPWIDSDEAARKGFTLDAFATKTAEMWSKGLAEWGQDSERIARFKNSVDMAIYTPGSNAGMPLSVLQSLESPSPAILEDEEAFRDRVLTLVSGLLALLGITADPIQSREHILLSNILHHVWGKGQSLNIADLIKAIQSPPFGKVGVFDLESFYSSKERFELAMQLNNLLASPGFSAWMEGEPLDVARLLYTASGKPRISILSIAHLSERERVFFVTTFLNEVISWMRSQPGTSSLRCLLYMDEIFGFFPPTANPPTKTPMLTLLKQARAYGLGVVLATQNPVDLDYKGLANAGTWFIGRLQTARDKERVLEGLEGASLNAGVAFDKNKIDKILSALGQRVFLMHNVHENAPVLFQTRWVLSYLRGPLTRTQIQTLMSVRKQEPVQEVASVTPVLPFQPVPSQVSPAVSAKQRPMLPPEIPELFLPAKGPLQANERLIYRPLIHGNSKLHYVSSTEKIDEWQPVALLSPLSPEQRSVSWEEAMSHTSGDIEFEREGIPQAQFGQLPAAALKPSSYKSWKTSLANHLYQNRLIRLWKSAELKGISNPGESEGDFRARLVHLARERRDLEVEKLRRRYAPKLARLQERLRGAEVRVKREQSQYSQQKVQTAISLGATVLGALFGRKVASTGNIGRATTAMRGAGRAAREKEDIDRAMREVKIIQEKLHDLEMEFEDEMFKLTESLDPETLDLKEVEVRPRKSDIFISPLSLVWSPWKVGVDGIAEPFFYPKLGR